LNFTHFYTNFIHSEFGLEDLEIPLDNRMEDHAMVTLDNAPVIFGGWDANAKLSSVYKLDLVARAWVRLPDMREARERHRVVAVPECWLCNNCLNSTSAGTSKKKILLV
jgi:hypothetical protein